MTKILILGDQGTGKSTLALVMARQLMLKDKNIILYTNMNIDGERIHHIYDWGQVPLNNENKIVIVDELMFSLDARESSSKHNRAVTRQIAFYRKARIILAIFMTHELGMVDVRLRDQLQYLIIGRKVPNVFNYLLYEKSSRSTTTLTLPRSQQVFDFADFDTLDHPDSLSSDILQLNPLFTPNK